MSDKSSEGAAILIVENDDVVATRVRDSLISAGYAARRAVSAEEALAMVQSTPPDLILMSLLLADSDGLILCSTIKAHSDAPVIILSVRQSEVDRALARESGAMDVLTRPVCENELLARVQSQLDQHVATPSGRA